jgi:hypothetical protein
MDLHFASPGIPASANGIIKATPCTRDPYDDDDNDDDGPILVTMIGARLLDHPLYGHFVCLTCRNNHKADGHEKLHLKTLAEKDPDSMTEHQVERHQMYQQRAIHKAQDQAARRLATIEKVGLPEYQSMQNVKSRTRHSDMYFEQGITRKVDSESRTGKMPRNIRREDAHYPLFFIDMVKDAVSTWIVESGDTHIFKDYAFQLFDMLLVRMDDILPPGVGGEFMSRVPRLSDGRVRNLREEYLKVIYFFCEKNPHAKCNTKKFMVKKKFLQAGEAGENARLAKRKSRARIDMEWERTEPTHHGSWGREIKNLVFLYHVVMHVMDRQP